MSLSYSLQATSVEKNPRNDCSYSHEDRPPSRMSRPRKSLSACTLLRKSRTPKLCELRKPQYSAPETQRCSSFEKISNQNCSFEFQRITPRISIDDTDSQTSVPSFHRHYLKYQTKCQVGPVHSIDSDTSKQISEDMASQNSKYNLQISQFREDGGSFSFSELDPVQEDLEIGEDLESNIRDGVTFTTAL